MRPETPTSASQGLWGGNATLNRAKGAAYRAAFLAECETAVTTGVALPSRDNLVARCGMPSRSALDRAISHLYAAGEVVPLPRRPGAAPRFRLRDGRTTPD
jgi:hypothetical protein